MGCSNTKQLPTTGCDELTTDPTPTSSWDAPFISLEVPKPSTTLPLFISTMESTVKTPTREVSPPCSPPRSTSPIITPEILTKRIEDNEPAPKQHKYTDKVEITLVIVPQEKVILFCHADSSADSSTASIAASIADGQSYKRSRYHHICENCSKRKSKHFPSCVTIKSEIYPFRIYKCEFCKQTPRELFYEPELNTVPTKYGNKITCTKCYMNLLLKKNYKSK